MEQQITEALEVVINELGDTTLRNHWFPISKFLSKIFFLLITTTIGNSVFSKDKDLAIHLPPKNRRFFEEGDFWQFTLNKKSCLQKIKYIV